MNDKIKIFGIEIPLNEFRIFIFILIAIVFAPILLSTILGYTNMKEAGGIGDFFNGLTAPFISFFGSILVYFALKSQIKANQIITDQFELQNQDSLFFRLVDNLHNRINNYSTFDFNKNEIKSYEVLKHIVEYKKIKMDDEAVNYGRYLLAKHPKEIPDKFYLDIVSLNNLPSVDLFEESNQLKSKLFILSDNERREFLKVLFGGRGYEKKDQRNILRAIGSVCFYKTEFKLRADIYANVFYETTNKFGGFMDGYFNVLEYLLKTVSEIKENSFYIEYIKNQLTKYEVILIFYFVASGKSSDFFKKFIIENNFLINLSNYNNYLIDLPSKEELEIEISSLL